MHHSLIRKVILTLLTAACLTSCSHQDLGRTTKTRTVDLPGGKPVIDTGGVSEQQRKDLVEHFQKAPHLKRTDYRMGTGDILEVTIPSLDAPNKSTRVSLEIREDGTINLPLAGKLSCTGMTTEECRTAIREAYDGKFLKNPDVSVKVTEHNSVAIIVIGAVESPGRYTLTQNRSTLFEMLARADGLAEGHGDSIFVTRKPPAEPTTAETPTEEKPRLIEVDLTDLMNTSNLDANIIVLADDIITVPPQTERFVYVLGYVNRPGSFTLKEDQDIDTTRILAMAGGLTATARGENSYIIRETENGQLVEPIDLKDISLGKAAPVYMRAGDTLVVGSSFLARLSEFIKSSVSAGFSVAPVP